MNHIRCPYCGAIASSERSVCPECGKLLPKQEDTEKNLEETDESQIPTAEIPTVILNYEDEDEEETGFYEYSYYTEREGSVLPWIALILILAIIAGMGYLFIFKPAVLDAGFERLGIHTNFARTVETVSGIISTPEPTVTAEPAATATAAPTAEAAADAPGDVIGTASIRVSGLRIRVSPSTTADVAGEAQQNKVYSVYETTEAGGYTWYCIGTDQWIADSGGQWVIYTNE